MVLLLYGDCYRGTMFLFGQLAGAMWWVDMMTHQVLVLDQQV
jgi:hypothetical protein